MAYVSRKGRRVARLSEAYRKLLSRVREKEEKGLTTLGHTDPSPHTGLSWRANAAREALQRQHGGLILSKAIGKVISLEGGSQQDLSAATEVVEGIRLSASQAGMFKRYTPHAYRGLEERIRNEWAVTMSQDIFTSVQGWTECLGSVGWDVSKVTELPSMLPYRVTSLQNIMKPAVEGAPRVLSPWRPFRQIDNPVPSVALHCSTSRTIDALVRIGVHPVDMDAVPTRAWEVRLEDHDPEIKHYMVEGFLLSGATRLASEREPFWGGSRWRYVSNWELVRETYGIEVDLMGRCHISAGAWSMDHHIVGLVPVTRVSSPPPDMRHDVHLWFVSQFQIRPGSTIWCIGANIDISHEHLMKCVTAHLSMSL